MTATGKTAVALGIAALVGFGLYEFAHHQQQRSELHHPQPPLEAARLPQPPAANADAVPDSSPAALVAQPPPPKAEGPDSTATPEQRIALLKQLLKELPAQSLPELKLLSDAEWLEIARAHELDAAADIRNTLAELRALARKKFAEILQEALRRFTTESGGELPASAEKLLPLLVAPADAEMLSRYELTRTGKLGDPSEKLLRENPTSDLILTVGIDGWSLSNNSNLPPAFGETDVDALERAKRALGKALGDDELMANLPSPAALSAVMKGMAETFDAAYGSEQAFGEAMKQAITTFKAAHPEESITNLAQIYPFLPKAEKFADAIRPILAQFEYLADHAGQPPPDSAALQPYLSRPFIATEALKNLKVTTDGEHGSISFNFTTKSKE